MKAFVALLALVPVAAMAQIGHPRGYDARHRIEQGIRRGSLTPREAARLRAERNRIQARARRDRRDGRGLSYAERIRLQRERARLNRNIYRQRHDRNHRPY